jgi:exopolysaccharide biosynthesis polyprenyl glycosylphosphotransferase
MRASLSAAASPAPTAPARTRLWADRALSQTAARLRGGLIAPLDGAWVALAMMVAHVLSPVFLGDLFGRGPLLAAATTAVLFVTLGHAVGLYDLDVLTRPGLILRRGAVAAVFSPVLTLWLFYLVLYQPIGRRVVASTVVLAAAGTIGLRLGLWSLLRRRPRRVLFVGDGPLARGMAESLRDGSAPYEVVEAEGPFGGPGTHAQLAELCRARDVDEIVLPLEGERLAPLLPPVLRCLPQGCQVRSELDFHEQVFRAVPVLHVSPAWLLGGGWDTSDHLLEIVKRVADVVLALVVLVVMLPVVAVAALLVWAEDGGSPLYSQVRLGRYGRPFRILKLRTMRPDAEAAEARWAEGRDPRRTRIGRLLRRTRIDELPQLVNILLGDMSFVGPRPERPEFVARLDFEVPYYAWRHLVRPGLTGWAQLQYPYGGSVEDARRKLEFDLYYVRHRSLPLDAVILLRTLTAVARGAR